MPRIPPPRLLCLIALAAVYISGAATMSLSSFEGTWFCKCICFSNYTIQPMYRPSNPSKPCLTCTKQWCLDQKLQICLDAGLGEQNPDTGTGKEGDVDTRCFQRDSPRDQMIVTLFLLIIIGLLIGAAVKTRLEQFGFDTNQAWSSGRAWWESLLPPRQADTAYSLGATSSSRSRPQYDRVPEEGSSAA